MTCLKFHPCTDKCHLWVFHASPNRCSLKASTNVPRQHRQMFQTMHWNPPSRFLIPDSFFNRKLPLEIGKIIYSPTCFRNKWRMGLWIVNRLQVPIIAFISTIHTIKYDLIMQPIHTCRYRNKNGLFTCWMLCNEYIRGPDKCCRRALTNVELGTGQMLMTGMDKCPYQHPTDVLISTLQMFKSIADKCCQLNRFHRHS